MGKATSLRRTKLLHRWFGLALVVGLLAGGAIGLPDWAFWAIFALGAGAGIVLEVDHWMTKRRGSPAPARTRKAKALRVNKFLHRWTGLIWATAMLLVFRVDAVEALLVLFLPMAVTGIVLTVRHWLLRLRRRRRRPGRVAGGGGEAVALA